MSWHRVARFAQRAAVAYGCAPAQHRPAAQRVRERDLRGRRPGPGTVPCCACTGSATTPAPRSSPSWPGWTRCATRPACAPRGCCPPRTAGGCWPCPTPGGATRATACRFEFLPGTEPADDDAAHFAELGEITARMHEHSRELGPAVLVHPVRWDYDGGVRRAAALGAVAGRHRRRPGRARGARPAGRGAGEPAGPVRHRAGPLRAGPRRPAAGQPAGGRRPASASSTSTTAASAGSSTTSAPR